MNGDRGDDVATETGGSLNGRRVLTALPVYNEEGHVADVLAEVKRHAGDVLAVNDGSTDATAERLAGVEGVAVVNLPVNFGYGAALKTAFHYAVDRGYDALVTIDCDGQHQPALIPHVAAALWGGTDAAGRQVGPADVVSGSRYAAEFGGNSLPPEERRALNAEITALLNERFGFELTDAFCGFKAYRTDALRRLDVREYGYAMPLQVWVQIADRGLSVAEFAVPLIYLEEERSFGGALDRAARRRAHYLHVIEREVADIAALKAEAAA